MDRPQERVLEIINDYNTFGLEETARRNNVKVQTVLRNIRRAKQMGIEPTTTWVPEYPNILLLDIETLPLELFSWNVGKAFVSHDNIIKEWSVLSWAGKWLLDDEVFGEVCTPQEAIDRDDVRILRELWHVMDKADVIIAHNGRRFDIRKINARFIAHGFVPPSPYDVVDTYKDIRGVAAFTSFKQDYLTKFFGLNEKLDTNFDLWKRCSNGDQEALDEMFTYNKQDIAGLEDLYLEFRAWFKKHPSLNLFYGDMQDGRCPRCGSTDTEQLTGKYYYTMAGRYKTHRCNDCGGLSRKGATTVTNSKNVLRVTYK